MIIPSFLRGRFDTAFNVCFTYVQNNFSLKHYSLEECEPGSSVPEACVDRVPDGIFAYQKSQLWYILEGLGKENASIY
jgi:hypothetical protein